LAPRVVRRPGAIACGCARVASQHAMCRAASSQERVATVVSAITDFTSASGSTLRELNFKHRSTPLSAALGSLLALGGIFGIEAAIRRVVPIAIPSTPHLSSFAALATLQFAAPAAPLGRPSNTVYGHCISVSIAIVVHWLELLCDVELTLLVPVLAIGVMAHQKVVNPPAAAAATAFAVSKSAHAMPLWGAVYLICPMLVCIAWVFLVQYALSRAVAALVRREAGAKDDARAPEPVVTVRCTRAVDATSIAEAVEGAAYVEDPIDFMIERLCWERERTQQLQRLVVGYMKETRSARDAAVSYIQQSFRKRSAKKRGVMKRERSVKGISMMALGGVRVSHAADRAQPTGAAAKELV